MHLGHIPWPCTCRSSQAHTCSDQRDTVHGRFCRRWWCVPPPVCHHLCATTCVPLPACHHLCATTCVPPPVRHHCVPPPACHHLCATTCVPLPACHHCVPPPVCHCVRAVPRPSERPCSHRWWCRSAQGPATLPRSVRPLGNASRPRSETLEISGTGGGRGVGGGAGRAAAVHGSTARRSTPTLPTPTRAPIVKAAQKIHKTANCCPVNSLAAH